MRFDAGMYPCEYVHLCMLCACVPVQVVTVPFFLFISAEGPKMCVCVCPRALLIRVSSSHSALVGSGQGLSVQFSQDPFGSLEAGEDTASLFSSLLCGQSFISFSGLGSPCGCTLHSHLV